MSPVQPSPVLMRHACSSELESVSPWKTRRARRRIRPIQVLEESVGVGPPTWTAQDASDLMGTVVRDCRPPLLPVSLWLKDVGQLPLRRTVASARLASPPPEDSVVIGGASPERVAIPELGVASSDDRGTDLEDELPTPEVSMSIGDSSPEGVRLLGVSVTPPDDSDSELEDELLNVSASLHLCHLSWSTGRFFRWFRLHIQSLLFLFSWTPLPTLCGGSLHLGWLSTAQSLICFHRI